MKHHAPQFEIPGAEIAFNLAGEVIREEPPKPKPAAKPDQTPSLFGPCPQWRPLIRDDGTPTRRCADCGAFKSEHEQQPATTKPQEKRP